MVGELPSWILMRSWLSLFVLSLAALLGGCPPATPRSAIDPKHVVDAARSKDLPGDVEALRKLADEIVDAKPDKAASYDRALAALEHALDKRPNDFELLWRAARACFLVTEVLPTPQDKAQELAYGTAGRDFGEHAAKEQAKRVEGHYYQALSASKIVEAKNNLRLLKPAVAAAEQAVTIDPKYDDAGPLRFLGKVYITAPAWPVSIGSPDKAVEMLERAVALSPAPLNRLFLGQAYFHEQEYGKAKAALERAIAEGKGKLHQRWQKEAEDYLRRLKAKTSS